MNSLELTTDEPTNEERAGRIDTVMQAYCLTLEGRDFDGDEDDVKDLLADLMHFCERMEIDFEENLRVARNNYEHERGVQEAGNGKNIPNLAMTLILIAFVTITTGCSHSGWVKFEEQTRVAGLLGGPMAAVHLVAVAGRLVVRNDGLAACHDCKPPAEVTADQDK